MGVIGQMKAALQSWRRVLEMPEKPSANASQSKPWQKKSLAMESLFHLIVSPGLAESPRNFMGFAVEGYGRNPVVYRAVRMISEAAARIPLRLTSEDQVLDRHPLLALLETPNTRDTRADLFERWFGMLLVSGNSFMNAVTVNGEVRELHVLRPDRVRIVTGSDGWPVAYDHEVNGRSIRYRRGAEQGIEPILHQVLFNPTSDLYGLSPIEAAAGAIDVHNKSSQWNLSLLNNAARPSGALVYNTNSIHLNDEQFERLKSELELSFQGAGNAGRPLLLEGGLDWKSMSLTPKDMDFIEAKHIAAREIALALGVPPMLLGIPGDNTYANYAEANRNFWRQTVLPLAGRLVDALNQWLGPAYKERVRLSIDLDQIEALAMEREALWSRLNIADFLTTDEKRQAVGLGPLSGPASGPPAGP